MPNVFKTLIEKVAGWSNLEACRPHKPEVIGSNPIPATNFIRFDEKPAVKIAGVPIEVFRAGDYGAKGSYSEDDLDTIVTAFDPAKHEPPITLHHDDKQGPHGVVEKLERRGKSLYATFRDVSSNLMGWLAERPYAKRSIELYPRESKMGLALRAVSFVSVPEVKGLAALPTFADENGHYFSIEFEDALLATTQNMNGHWHSVELDKSGNGTTSAPIRISSEANYNTVIEQGGHTHQVMAWVVQDADGHGHAMSVTTRPELSYGEAAKDQKDSKDSKEQTNMTTFTEEQVQEREKAAAEAARAAERAEYSDRVQALEMQERQRRVSDTIDALGKMGVAPAVLGEPGLVEFCRALDEGAAIKFGDAETTSLAWFKEFVGKHGVKVPTKAPIIPEKQPIEFSGGDEWSERDRKAKEFMDQNKEVCYADALTLANR